MIFRLRHGTADSPPYPAESDSLSYGLPFRFQLLSTPFHNDAVTFSYGVMAYADRDFHPVDKLPLWAHSPPAKLGGLLMINYIEPISSNPDTTVGNWGKQILRSSTDKEYQGLQNSANGSN